MDKNHKYVIKLVQYGSYQSWDRKDIILHNIPYATGYKSSGLSQGQSTSSLILSSNVVVGLASHIVYSSQHEIQTKMHKYNCVHTRIRMRCKSKHHHTSKHAQREEGRGRNLSCTQPSTDSQISASMAFFNPVHCLITLLVSPSSRFCTFQQWKTFYQTQIRYSPLLEKIGEILKNSRMKIHAHKNRYIWKESQ